MTVISLEQILDDIVKAPIREDKSLHQQRQSVSRLAQAYDVSGFLKGVGNSLTKSCKAVNNVCKRLVSSFSRNAKYVIYPVKAHKRDFALVAGYGVSALLMAYFNETLPIVSNFTDSLGDWVNNPNFGGFVQEIAPSIGAATSFLVAYFNIQENSLRGLIQGLSLAALSYNIGPEASEMLPGIESYVSTVSYGLTLGTSIYGFYQAKNFIF